MTTESGQATSTVIFFRFHLQRGIFHPRIRTTTDLLALYRPLWSVWHPHRYVYTQSRCCSAQGWSRRCGLGMRSRQLLQDTRRRLWQEDLNLDHLHSCRQVGGGFSKLS